MLQQTHAQPRHHQEKFPSLSPTLLHALICLRQCRSPTTNAPQTEFLTGQ